MYLIKKHRFFGFTIRITDSEAPQMSVTWSGSSKATYLAATEMINMNLLTTFTHLSYN